MLTLSLPFGIHEGLGNKFKHLNEIAGGMFSLLLIKANKVFSCTFQKYINKNYSHSYLFIKGHQQFKPYSPPNIKIIKCSPVRYSSNLIFPIILITFLWFLTICTYKQPIAKSARLSPADRKEIDPSSKLTVDPQR